ncbi:unnamed protein product, partial [Hapterophycus canaliculatus]
RFFASVVDSTDKLDRLLASLDTPSRSDFEASHARKASSTEDSLDSGIAANTVQFNTKEEANGRQELTKSLREFGKNLASDAVVIDLRAVAFWCLAKRQRLWSEDEKLTREEQLSLRNIRAMQVNHEEVDTVLGDRQKLIEDKMMHMQREVGSKSKGWTEVLLDVKDGVIRSRAQAQKRTREIISATEARIAALKTELMESEHHVVGLSNESEEFARAKGMYTRKAELLEHVVQQQRARLEQITLELTRAKKEATSLDDNLQNINQLTSVAEGGGSDTIDSREQNEGREKLQAREEARRHNEEQMRAITKRASLLEENKRLRVELEKAESVFDLSQTPEEIRKSQLRLHQTEARGIDHLRAGVKSASIKLSQTERQLAQLASRKVGKSTQSAQPKADQPRTAATTSTPAAVHDKQGGAKADREGNQVDSQAWYHLEMLRAQHGVLVEDLEKSDAPSDGGDDPLRDVSLLTAARWQLRDEGTQDAEAKQEGDAALELAAVAVAAELTSRSSGLPQKVLNSLDWEGQARPLEEKLVSKASRVRWMYMLRLAVELGQCDLNKWQEFRDMLSGEGAAPFDLRGLHNVRQGVHALLHSFDGEPPIFRGAFSRQTQSRAELTDLIESGQARLARLNVLLRLLWSESARKISSAERTSILNDIIGMLVGESQLYPKLALRLFSVLGHDVIRRARSGPESVPQTLPGDVAKLNLSSKGIMDEKNQRAATTVSALAALLRISEALSNTEPPVERAQSGAALQDRLRVQIKTYSNHKHSQQIVEDLDDAEDFIKELPPEESEHGPGNSQLDIMMHLLWVLTRSRRRHEYDFFQANFVAEMCPDEISSDFGTPPNGKTPGEAATATLVGQGTMNEASRNGTNGVVAVPSQPDRQLGGRDTLPEILTKITGAMSCEPDQRLAHVWRTLEERIARPRGGEEIELEAFELAVDAQVLEAVRVCLLEAIESPGLGDPPSSLPVRVGEAVRDTKLREKAGGGRNRWGNAPFSGSEVADNEKAKKKALQRQAETLQFKNKLNVAARTGLAIQSPVQIGNSSMTAVIAAAAMAKRWKSAALGDGSGLDR